MSSKKGLLPTPWRKTKKLPINLLVLPKVPRRVSSQRPGAKERLSLFSASLLEENSFDEAINGCHGVFHTASPLVPGKGVEDPENMVLRPAIEGALVWES